jgi:hypothetical protein
MKVLKLFEWLSINEDVNLQQFSISQEIIFKLKEKYNIEESLSFDSLDLNNKKDFFKFVKENKAYNIYFGYDQESGSGMIIYNDLFSKENYFSVLRWKDENVNYESTDSLITIIKGITENYKFYGAKNPLLWIENNSSLALRKFLTDWNETVFSKFNVFVDRYYKESREEIKEKFKGIIELDNIEETNEEILDIKNYFDDSKVYKKYVINNKKNLLYFIVSWIKNNYKEYKKKESILYYSSIIKELSKSKGKDQLIKDFLMNSVK